MVSVYELQNGIVYLDAKNFNNFVLFLEIKEYSCFLRENLLDKDICR